MKGNNMDHFKHNSKTWDKESSESGRWSRPVSSIEIEAAKNGSWSIVLTPVKAVPRSWFPENMINVKVLLVAGGGGQQTPIIAATEACTVNRPLLTSNQSDIRLPPIVATSSGHN